MVGRGKGLPGDACTYDSKERPRGASRMPSRIPAARSWARAETPPDRCQPRRRWLGNSLRPPGRGRRSRCSRSGADPAAAPTVTSWRGPHRTASAASAAIPDRISNRRLGRSSCGMRSPARWLTAPRTTAHFRDGAIAPTAAPEATCSDTIMGAPWPATLMQPPGARLILMAQAPVLPRGFELPLEPRLPRIGSVDAVALEERAGSLARRSIKREAKVFALELAVRMMDLTTLEGQDTSGKVAALASKAIRPDPSDPGIPSVAAICVYPNLVPAAVARVEGSSVKVASVATAFPSGQSPLESKLEEVRWVVAQGAHEVDMVIDRGAFLSGRYAKVYDEIVRVKEACGDAHLKVILGMLEAIRDVHDETGRMVGMKPAGGIRQAKQAVQYLVQLHETLGPGWLTPDLYRFGASSLLNDVLMQLRKEKTGSYQSPDYFTLD